jgi:hypothetical protein
MALTGCGSSGSVASEGNCDGGCWQPTAADQTFIDDFCAAIAPCCQAAFGMPGDTTACATALRGTGVSADATLTAACLAELAPDGGASNCGFDIGDLSDPCVRALSEPSGPRSPGQSCTNSSDCAGIPRAVAFCASAPTPSNPSAAICASRKPGHLGDSPCLATMSADGVIINYPLVFGGSDVPVATGFLCQASAGLFCDPTSRKCVSLLPAGSPCGNSPPGVCASTCSPGGVCEAVASVGQSCDGGACDSTSFCDTTGTCAPKLPDGASCNEDKQCSGACLMPSGAPGTCSSIASGTALALGLGFCRAL